VEPDRQLLDQPLGPIATALECFLNFFLTLKASNLNLAGGFFDRY
jgi:hypothetical protein